MDLITRVAAAPFAVACLLLASAGVAKVRRPVATQGAAAALGLPSSRATVRALGLVEVGTAAAGLVFGHLAAVVVTVLYAALAIAAARLYLRAPDTPCGCLGASDAPVSSVHIAVNIVAVIAATLAIAGGSPAAAAGDNWWLRVAFVVLAGCGAALLDVALDTLPALGAAVHEGRSA